MHSLLSSLGLANPLGHRSQDWTHRGPQCPLVAMVPTVAWSFPELRFLRRSWLKGLWAMAAKSPVSELPPMPLLEEWARSVGVGTGHPTSVVWARTGLESPAGPALCLRCLHSTTDPPLTSPGPSDHMTIWSLTGRTGYHPNKEAGKPRSGSSLTWAKSRSRDRGAGSMQRRPGSGNT